MSYYKLQAIFLFIICSIYILVTNISFQVKDNLLIQKETQTFEYILKEKNQLLKGIKSPDEEVFANYPKKLKLINITTSPFIEKLHTIFKKKSWKSTLKDIHIPFAKHSCLIIGKNGKQQTKIGHSMNDVFDLGWEKSTFIALKNKSSMFHRIEAIFPYKMSVKTFNDYFQKFQVTHQKNNLFVYRYYTKVGKFEVFYFLRLNGIQAMQLQESVLNFFALNNSKLSPSKTDELLWNKTLPLSKFKPGFTGLTYSANKSTYYKYLLSLKYFNIIFFLSFAIIYFYGGYKVIVLNFQFRFLFLYLFFIYILSLIFIQSFELLKSNKKALLKRQVEVEFSSELKKIENKFHRFKDKVKDELLMDFDTNQLYKSKYWKYDIHGIYSKKGYTSFSDKDMDHNNYTALARYMPYLAGKQPEFELKSKLTKDIFKYLNINPRLEKLVILDIFTNNDKHITIKEGGRIFTKFSHRTFKSIPIMKESIEVLFATKGINETFEAFIAKTSLDSLQSTFFELTDLNATSHKLIIKSQRNNSDLYEYPHGSLFNSQEFEGLHSRFIDIKGSLFQFHKNQKDWFGMHIKSNIFQYYDLLFIIPRSVLFNEIHEMEQNLHYFLWFFYLTVLVISYILTLMILKPVSLLRQGLIQVKANNLDTKFDVTSIDERGLILHRFNSMVGELQRKEKMLPFISSAVFNLLTTDSGKIETKYTGNAIVLFSDIKSFTSISETRDPQEVVDMLNDYFSIWQEKIEKNGGIVDRFIGDAISVVYFEKSSPHFVQQAIQTSVEVMEALEKFNDKRRESGEFLIENGVGLCYGEVYFSMVGDQNKMEFLTQGTPVVLSEYLEGQSRYSTHSHIILDPYIKNAVEYQYDFAPFEVEDKSLGTFYELVL